MDPALQEYIFQEAQESELEAIVKLVDADVAPVGLKIVARFGDIATCRLPVGQIHEVWSHEAVRSLKAPRYVNGEPIPTDDTEQETISIPTRKHQQQYSGKGVVIGIVDWGFDFTHSNFIDPETGHTRFLAIWDQTAPYHPSAEKYGYGQVYSQNEINRALQSDQPFDTLGYVPGKADIDGKGTHGTHVTDIAAGNGMIGEPGVAPQAQLIGVHLSAGNIGGLANLGDSVRILEAIDFIDHNCQGLPLVMNLSVGKHGGCHQGKSLVEQGFDNFLQAQAGRAIINSAGNYYSADIHASGRVLPGGEAILHWEVDENDSTPNELEVWYAGQDAFTCHLRCLADEKQRYSVKLGEKEDILYQQQIVGRIYHRSNEPNTGNHHINIFLYKNAPKGLWEVALEGINVVDGRYHAWIERDGGCNGCQSRFIPEHANPGYTTGSICNGLYTITVGAADPYSEKWAAASFSSSGPTADGRQKPNLLAPGVNIRAARSVSLDNTHSPSSLTTKSGTSMAAPHVTGAVALLFEASSTLLPIDVTRNRLLSRLRPHPEESATEDLQRGIGLLDIDALLPVAGITENTTEYLPQSKIPTPESNIMHPEISQTEQAYTTIDLRLVIDSNAIIRQGPPSFTGTASKLKRYTIVQVVQTQVAQGRSYVEVATPLPGGQVGPPTLLGWTLDTNLESNNANLINWGNFKQDLVAEAERTYNAWNVPAILFETNSQTFAEQRAYWQTVRLHPSDSQLESSVWQGGHAWSAAYISNVVQRAGAGNHFCYNATHSCYIVCARRNREYDHRQNPFWAYPVNATEVAWPEPGDIVCKNRSGGTLTLANTTCGNKSHCDIVISVDREQLRMITIGGNVDNRVARRIVQLTPHGFIDPAQLWEIEDAGSRQPSASKRSQGQYFAIIKVRTSLASIPVAVSDNIAGSNEDNFMNVEAVEIDELGGGWTEEVNETIPLVFDNLDPQPDCQAVHDDYENEPLPEDDSSLELLKMQAVIRWGNATRVVDPVFYASYPEWAGKVFNDLTKTEKSRFSQNWKMVAKELIQLRKKQVTGNLIIPAIGGDLVPLGFKKTNYSKYTGLTLHKDYGLHLNKRLDVTLADLVQRGKIQLTQDELDIFQRIANVETSGQIQTINTYDRAIMTIGFMQFTLHVGKIQEWIKLNEPAFSKYGIELDPGQTYRIGKETVPAIKGISNDRLDDIRWNGWAERFYYAGLDEDIIIAQVALAKRYLLLHLNDLKYRLKKNHSDNSNVKYNNFKANYYNKDAYVRGLFQESHNNHPTNSTQCVNDALDNLEEGKTSVADFLKKYKFQLTCKYGNRLVVETATGTELILPSATADQAIEQTSPPPCHSFNCWLGESLNTIMGSNLPVGTQLSREQINLLHRFQNSRRFNLSDTVNPVTERALLEAMALQNTPANSTALQLDTTASIVKEATQRIVDYTGQVPLTACMDRVNDERRKQFYNYRQRRAAKRDPRRIKALVLHHMAFLRTTQTPRAHRCVNSHFIILQNGSIYQLHPISALLWASHGWNPRSVAVEFAGHFRNENGGGPDIPTSAQIEAGQFLVKYLVHLLGIDKVLTHRQSSTKTGDPGPDIWFQVGEWSMQHLGITDTTQVTHGDGTAIPQSWRTWNPISDAPSRVISKTDGHISFQPTESHLPSVVMGNLGKQPKLEKQLGDLKTKLQLLRQYAPKRRSSRGIPSEESTFYPVSIPGIELDFNYLISDLHDLETAAIREGYSFDQRLSAIRKIFYHSGTNSSYSSGGWDVVIPGAKNVHFPSGWRTDASLKTKLDNVKKLETLKIWGKDVAVSHLFAGLDAGNHLESPLSLKFLNIPVVRISNNKRQASYVGDLGSVVYEYQKARNNASFRDAAMNKNADVLKQVYDRFASAADMAGNADAYALVLDKSITVVENIFNYYTQLSPSGSFARYQYFSMEEIGSPTVDKFIERMINDLFAASETYAVGAKRDKAYALNHMIDPGPGVFAPTLWEATYNASHWVLEEFLNRVNVELQAYSNLLRVAVP